MARKIPVTIVPIRRPPSISGLMMPTTIGKTSGISARQHHVLDRGARDDVDGAPVLGLAGSLHDPGDLPELPPHLLDDLTADTADSLHRERGEEEGHEAADEEARDHPAVGELEDGREPSLSSSDVKPSKRTSAASPAEPIA